MILLATDCLIFRTATGETVPGPLTRTARTM